MNFRLKLGSRFAGVGVWVNITAVLTLVVMLSGCVSDQFDASGKPTVTAEPPHTEVILLQAGDEVKISFPGSPSLDTAQQIRRDGKIQMSLVGDVQAAGKTVDQLKDDLVKLYASQISSKEVNVAVVSSAITVYVTGFVMHPGKVLSDKPITALEAIMESGGFDFDKADLRSVRVIRLIKGVSTTYYLNLKSVLNGEVSQQFYLKDSDIVYVPERFSWF